MAQTPANILQDAFGNIRVEFISGDLGLGKEAVNGGHGVAQIRGCEVVPGRWRGLGWGVAYGRGWEAREARLG